MSVKISEDICTSGFLYFLWSFFLWRLENIFQLNWLHQQIKAFTNQQGHFLEINTVFIKLSLDSICWSKSPSIHPITAEAAACWLQKENTSWKSEGDPSKRVRLVLIQIKLQSQKYGDRDKHRTSAFWEIEWIFLLKVAALII